MYFYRTTVRGAAVQPEVRLNGEVVGKTDAGQVRYVRLNISMGFFVGHVYGELVDEVKGQAEIMNMRYTGAPAAKP